MHVGTSYHGNCTVKICKKNALDIWFQLFPFPLRFLKIYTRISVINIPGKERYASICLAYVRRCSLKRHGNAWNRLGNVHTRNMPPPLHKWYAKEVQTFRYRRHTWILLESARQWIIFINSLSLCPHWNMIARAPDSHYGNGKFLAPWSVYENSLNNYPPLLVGLAQRRRRPHLGAPRLSAARKLPFKIMFGLLCFRGWHEGTLRTWWTSTRVYATPGNANVLGYDSHSPIWWYGNWEVGKLPRTRVKSSIEPDQTAYHNSICPQALHYISIPVVSMQRLSNPFVGKESWQTNKCAAYRGIFMT